MRKVVFVIDGWFMRKRVYKLKAFYYDGPRIREYCKKHLRSGDQLYRIFYYDTMPLDIKAHNPLTKKFIDFSKTPTAIDQRKLLNSIKRTPNFALRLGHSYWVNKEWIIKPDRLKELLQCKIGISDLNVIDIYPRIEQKTVDMKIGLDIAYMAERKVADVLILIAGDSDIVPALKFARREGMLVGLDPLQCQIRPELSEHVDFLDSKLPLPKPATKADCSANRPSD